MVKIVLHKFCEISGQGLKEIVNPIEQCYERLKPHPVEILDLLIFESPAAVEGFYSRERAALGVTSESFGEWFFARHDAWRGTPRITLCLQHTEELPELVRVGALRHEVGHSVLHGSWEYYMFSMPQPIIEASERFKLPRGFSQNLLYLISIAVKDFEVTRFLSEKGYVEDQVAYSEHVLKSSEEDLAAWRIAEGNPSGMALCLAGRLKDAACTIALLPRLGESSVIESIKDEFSYMPDRILGKMLRVVKEFAQTMVGDTFENVNAATRIFTEHLLEPLFRSEA